MSHSLHHIWIHIVWSTKDREPFFSKTALHDNVIPLLKIISKEEEVILDSINGYKDHIHCLIALPSDYKLSDFVKKMKGKSSYLLKNENLVSKSFQWGVGYFAVSVSPKFLKTTRNYIDNQWEKHEFLSFEKEMNYFKSLVSVCNK